MSNWGGADSEIPPTDEELDYINVVGGQAGFTEGNGAQSNALQVL
jgi:hypothetical protein